MWILVSTASTASQCVFDSICFLNAEVVSIHQPGGSTYYAGAAIK